MVHGMAFYVVPLIPKGMAGSFSMKAVNLRTGLPEEDRLTDEPCQSYWTTRVHTPWIDGYRPSSTDAVRQFVPLRGDKEMVADVATFVGIQPDNPWRDGISVAYYLPRDIRELGQHDRDDLRFMYKGSVYEDETLEMAGPVTFGVSRTRREPGRMVEEVGMGAGALMKQQHPDVPGVSSDQYHKESLVRMTARLVWHEQWNSWAQACGATPISPSLLRELKRRQDEYETEIRMKLGGKPVATAVDQLPQIK